MTDFRATQIGIEVWGTSPLFSKVSQEVIEVPVVTASDARVSQQGIETPVVAAPVAYVTQEVVEAPIDAAPITYVTQEFIETPIDARPVVYTTQAFIEALIVNVDVLMPAVYPSLIGLAYDVHWRLKFASLPTQTTSALADLDLSLADAPIHEFDLTYEYLPNRQDRPRDMKTLMGFYGATRGCVGRFLFRNPDDTSVTRQEIAVTNGVDHVYQLVRTFGLGDNSFTEPIGYLDQTEPFALYLDDVYQDPSTYNIVLTEPVNQYIQFVGVPTAGQVIRVDMSYFYYCKFVDPQLDLTKFMDGYWSADTVKLRSCRAGA